MAPKNMRRTRVLPDPVNTKANFLAFLADGPAGERPPMYAGPLPQAGVAAGAVTHSTTAQIDAIGSTVRCTCGWTQYVVAGDDAAQEAAYTHRVRAIRAQGSWRGEA